MNRINHLQSLLKKNTLDAYLIASVAQITYLTDFSNFSVIEREAYLLITNKTNYLFTDGRYIEAVKKEVKRDFVCCEISADKPFRLWLKELVEKEKISAVGFEEHILTVAEYVTFKKIIPRLVPFSLEDLRIIKDRQEIEHIAAACKLGDQTVDYIVKKIIPGMTEKQIAFLMEMFIKEKGVDLSFPTIVAFGANSAIPHHQTGKQELKTNDTILLDFGVKYNYG